MQKQIMVNGKLVKGLDIFTTAFLQNLGNLPFTVLNTGKVTLVEKGHNERVVVEFDQKVPEVLPFLDLQVKDVTIFHKEMADIDGIEIRNTKDGKILVITDPKIVAQLRDGYYYPKMTISEVVNNLRNIFDCRFTDVLPLNQVLTPWTWKNDLIWIGCKKDATKLWLHIFNFTKKTVITMAVVDETFYFNVYNVGEKKVLCITEAIELLQLYGILNTTEITIDEDVTTDETY